MAAAPHVKVSRKLSVWLKKPSPGPHSQGVALSTVLKEQLGLVETVRQAKKLVSGRHIFVDGRTVSDVGFPVGLMDTIHFPRLDKSYLMVFRHGKLVPLEVQASHFKLLRIMDKTPIRGGRIQLNLHDGSNYLIVKEEDRFKVGDTLRLKVPVRQMDGFLKMEKGATCYIFRGRHSGEIAVLEGMLEREGSKKTEALLKSGDREIITLKDYLFVVDPQFSVNETHVA